MLSSFHPSPPRTWQWHLSGRHVHPPLPPPLLSDTGHATTIVSSRPPPPAEEPRSIHEEVSSKEEKTWHQKPYLLSSSSPPPLLSNYLQERHHPSLIELLCVSLFLSLSLFPNHQQFVAKSSLGVLLLLFSSLEA